METLLLALSPFVVAFITQASKKLGAIKYSGYRVTLLRFVAVLFTFLSIVATSIATGQEIDVTSIETLVQGLMIFLSATGTYFLSKKKSTQ